jgi:hypothetical protein
MMFKGVIGSLISCRDHLSLSSWFWHFSNWSHYILNSSSFFHVLSFDRLYSIRDTLESFSPHFFFIFLIIIFFIFSFLSLVKLLFPKNRLLNPYGLCKKIKVKMELEKKFLCYIKLDLTQFNSKPKPYKARVKRSQLLDLIFSSR